MECLQALSSQVVHPDEVVVIWQGEDLETKNVVEAYIGKLPFTLLAAHSTIIGIVPAENTGLEKSTGDIVLLLDDDAIPRPDWIEKHLAFYKDPKIGAVGGPYNNFRQNGERFTLRRPRAIGRLRWFGRSIGQMFDFPDEWTARPYICVDHLAGGNMSLRRKAFKMFNPHLKPYWQLFEMEACLQIKKQDYKIVFDFSNPVSHYPTSKAHVQSRCGDLTQKVFHLAYNHAFILAKHSPLLLIIPRLTYLLMVGTCSTPGFFCFFLSIARYGQPRREFKILLHTMSSHISGWIDGSRREGDRL